MQRTPIDPLSSTPRPEAARSATAIAVGFLAVASVGLLIGWDAYPQSFPGDAHDLLGALPLGLIALAYLAYHGGRHPKPRELLKAAIVAAAFLFWAANQLWPQFPQATLFNDIAIALFVLDVFLVIVGWPPGPGRESFAETSFRDDTGR